MLASNLAGQQPSASNCAWFSEDFDVWDLIEAKALLFELAGEIEFNKLPFSRR